MAIDFNALRARKGTNFQALQTKLEKTGQNGGGFKKDERIWKPTRNAKDNKSVNIIRFLPIPFVDEVGVEEGKYKAEDLTPMAKILSHGFQGPKGWYIEKSLQTFGEDCPVRAYDGPLWGTAKKNNDEILKNALKKRLPSTTYYANVLIIKDGTNPENNGKVMIYEFGETIRKILEKCNKPEFDTDPIFDPFDMFEGADLILNLTYTKKKIGEKEIDAPNFDSVKWATQGPLSGGDEAEMERIWKASHSIAEFYDRKNFKTYDELKAKYEKVMGIGAEGGSAAPAAGKPKTAEQMLDEMTGGSKEAPAEQAKSAPAPSVGKSSEAAPLAGDSDEMAEFERLLSGV
jgi:hypothetical protein